jgi:glc operon protein GlcG
MRHSQPATPVIGFLNSGLPGMEQDRRSSTGAGRLEQVAMLTLAEANQAITAALARAQNMKMEIAVSVCDEGGRLVAFQRMDGVLLEKIWGAIGKAKAAAATRKPSGEGVSYSDLRSVWRVAGAGLPITGRPGGLPITRNAQTVGAIGVSGSPTDREDEQFAKAGVEALDQSS